MYNCYYGGICIDPGIPSDCEINNCCLNFKNKEEKLIFDALPDVFLLELNNKVLKFKNATQVIFFLRDNYYWQNANIYLIDSNKIKVEVKFIKLE